MCDEPAVGASFPAVMIFTRFECPRCQHVFIKDGADDAFADCPKCQSMALAIGEASAGDSQPVPQLSSDEGAPVPEEPAPPSEEVTHAAAEQPAGVFSGLLGDSSEDGFVPDVTHDDMRVPATLEESQRAQAQARAAPEEDDPFGESTRQVDPTELPASLMLTRGEEVAAPGAADGDDFDPFAGIDLPSGEEEQDIHLAPTDVLRSQNSDSTQIAPNPLADESAWENGPPPGLASEDDPDDEDAWENGPPPSVPTAEGAAEDPLDESAWENGPPEAALPSPPPSPEQSGSFVRPAAFAITHDDEEPVTSQPEGGAAPAPFDSGFFDAGASGPQPAAAPLAGDEFNAPPAAPEPVATGGGQQAWDPGAVAADTPQAAAGQQAMSLDQIEGQMQGQVQFQDADSVGLADAFSQLEAAFDGAAAAPDPQPEPPAQNDHGGMDLDPAFQMAQAAAEQQSSSPSVPAPPSADEPPPMRRARQRGHLTLSEEAKALAGIPIQPEAGSHNLALELTRGAGAEAEPPAHPAHVSTPGIAPPEVALEPPGGAEGPDVTDPVSRRARPQGARAAEPEEEEERTFRGFTVVRILLVVVVASLLGGAVGALIAPTPEKKTITARDRAEQKFARGNRFYEEGRIDDALGEYRGALSLDPTLAPAHRAKAAALAKLQRHEEAARAYAKYLEVAPSAIDAGEVREVLARWEGKTGS